MTYRPLNVTEISTLEQQGCRADNWNDVLVPETFLTDRIVDVSFSGRVQLGQFESTVSLPGGVIKPCGLYNSHIHQCTIGDQAYISNVQTLANYEIKNDVVIENVGSLTVEGDSLFGNGTEIEILNEGGGRPLKIFDRLSAQIAYFLVLYRHRPQMIENLESLIDDYVQSKKSSQGIIGEGSTISNCTTMVNLEIGASAQIQGALHLQNGTLGSCKEAPIKIGHGVYAKDFIVLSGSQVDNASVLTACFVGQGVKIGRQYSAENSAFFANSEGFHGEACSVFAGPYTVTHHKSTLLIGGLFSFYNAGSGTNQSNHMYKLGPVHQGILERGSKTGSFSYLLWPCRIGAFSAVIGKHYDNFDTSDLPFSYINEVDGKSVLTPAMNLFTVGTRRDSAKWPARDRRKDPDKLDLIHFSLFSPYTVGKMVRGGDILTALYENAQKKQSHVNYHGIYIKRLLLKTCKKYYEMGIKIFIGDCLLNQLKQFSGDASDEEILSLFQKTKASQLSNWLDICGLQAPDHAIEDMLNAIEQKEFESIEAIQQRLKTIHAEYDKSEWAWCAALVEKRFGMPIDQISAEQILQILTDWKSNRVKLNNMILNDAEKEFDEGAQIGFGIDGDAKVRKEDFDAVRGTAETNSFIRELREENQQVDTFLENTGIESLDRSNLPDRASILKKIIEALKNQ